MTVRTAQSLTIPSVRHFHPLYTLGCSLFICCSFWTWPGRFLLFWNVIFFFVALALPCPEARKTGGDTSYSSLLVSQIWYWSLPSTFTTLPVLFQRMVPPLVL